MMLAHEYAKMVSGLTLSIPARELLPEEERLVWVEVVEANGFFGLPVYREFLAERFGKVWVSEMGRTHITPDDRWAHAFEVKGSRENS